jgi:DNA modification methylase
MFVQLNNSTDICRTKFYTTMQDYIEFLERKKVRITESGFEVSDDSLNPHLFDFQRFIVKKALKAGKYAIFADCGLGKTLMQLEWARHVVEHTGKPVLILCPLAVAGQTIQEGVKFGIEVEKYFPRLEHNRIAMEYEGENPPCIFIANYDQLENIDASIFSGVVLDESSILKNYEGATKNAVIEAFANTPYKLACTATPSPNDFMELGNHAEFLNVMSRNEMLAMYFVHDGGETTKWRLKGHSEEIFWQWVAGWGVMLTKPSDIGFSATGYDLPALNFIEKQIVTPKRDNGTFFNDVAVSATDFNGELRLTKVERLSEVIEIVNNSTENFIIWVKQNEEADYLRQHIPDAIEVRGSDSPERKEGLLLGFGKNDYRVLITKAKIAQYGLNYQNCRNQIFASLDFSFESLYQAIRRSYRFGQKNEVNVYIITTDTMQNVIQAISTKQKQFEKMQQKMAQYSKQNIETGNTVKIAREYETKSGYMWEARLGDCVQLIQEVPDESLDFSVFSPPFAELYTYSDELEDMGNSRDYNEFLMAFNYLTKELYRTIRSGRNVAIHCMDLPIQKGKHGFIGLRDFSGLILKSMEDAGFIYHSRVTIWKNPVTEMQRTKALGLLHKQLKKDATMSRVGIPDYVLIFRKDGDRDNPVSVDIPVDLWQKWASPVWMDIDYGDTLNRNEAREEKDEKHICPLQLPTIERLIGLYTNPGDLVFTPFGGIFSEIFQAVKMGRRGLAFELKKQYFDVGTKNMVGLEMSKQQLDIFSMATV